MIRFLAVALSTVLLLSGIRIQAGEQAANPASDLGSGRQWTDDEKTTQRSAAGQLLASLKDALARGERQFTIPAGDYRFDAQLGSGFEFTGINGLELDAAGATFWFDGRFGIRLNDCSNISLQGLTFDMDPLPWTQGTITAIDLAANTIDIRLEPGYSPPAPAQAGRRILFFSAETGNELHTSDETFNVINPIGGGIWRVSSFNRSDVFQGATLPHPVRLGDRVALLIGGGSNISLKNCGAITLQKITVYGSSGFVFHEDGGAGGNQYLQCRLVRRPGTNRLLASAADGFHSASMLKGPHIEQSEFSFAADDLVAIHGFFLMAAQASEGKDALIASPYPVDWTPASSIRFYRPPNGNFLSEAIIQDVKPETDATLLAAARNLPQQFRTKFGTAIRPMDEVALYRVKFDRDVSLGEGDLATGPEACGAGAVVKNNFLHDGHVRGLLAKTEDLLAEGNRIERTAYAGIDIEPELFWLEGPFENRIQITNNELDEDMWSSFAEPGRKVQGGAIVIRNSFGQGDRALVQGKQNRGLEITGNTINRAGGSGIFVANADGLQIVNNHITQPFAAAKDAGTFDFTNCLAKDWKVTPQEADIVKNAAYGIYIQESDKTSVSANSVTSSPAWMRGSIGYGPGAQAPAPGE